MSFAGKTIIVTGAASGIGAETTRQLKALGAKVIGMDINDSGHNADEHIHVDLSDPASIEVAAAQVKEPVDGLANIAGVPPSLGQVKVVQINFMGLVKLTECLVSKIADGGAIVNVASLAGAGWPNNLENVKQLIALESFDDVAGYVEDKNIVNDGLTSDAAYPHSKEAVIVWTIKNAARWSDRGIRMNVVNPGPVETPIIGDFIASFGEAAAKDIEDGGGAGKPEGIAPSIVFMLSEQANWISGAALPVDGGVYAKIQGGIFEL